MLISARVALSLLTRAGADLPVGVASSMWSRWASLRAPTRLLISAHLVRARSFSSLVINARLLIDAARTKLAL